MNSGAKMTRPTNKNNKNKKAKKIVWAIDPFAKTDSQNRQIVSFLEKLNAQHPVRVQPVYILSLNALNWVGQVSAPNLKSFVPPSVQALKAMLAEFSKLEFFDDPLVVTNQKLGLNTDVKSFVSFLEKNKPDLVVLSTHARSGFDRIFLGSFAEQIILNAKTPLLVFNPKMKLSSSIKCAMFATDLTSSSQKAFKHFTRWAKPYIKEIEIFNQISHPIDAFVQPTVAMAGGGWVTFDQYMTHQNKRRTKLGETWRRQSEKLGFQTKLLFNDSSDSIAEALVKEAENSNCDLIAIGADSGQVATVAFGSVVRNLVRQSSRPVWIVRS